MSNENVEEFSGIIEDIQPQFDKNKKLFFKFKINGLTYNWFTANDKPGEETAKSLNKGDGVKGLVELNDGEYNGKPITYRNIKEMHKEQLPQQAVQESEPQPKEKFDILLNHSTTVHPRNRPHNPFGSAQPPSDGRRYVDHIVGTLSTL